MKKTTKGNASRKQEAVTSAALKILSSPDYFAHLKGALYGLGLAGWEIPLGMGVQVAAVSRSQPFPLRSQIRQETEGTAEYMVKKVAQLTTPGDVVILDPDDEKSWERFAQAPDGKVLFIPGMVMETEAGFIRFDVQGDRIVREIPERRNGRVTNQKQEVRGRFVCISMDRPIWDLRRPRWLTMQQEDRQATTPSGTLPPDFEVWQEVDRLLKEQAKRRVWVPEWGQIVIEKMYEGDGKALMHVAALMQIWRTMCVIRSFRSGKAGTGKSLVASFEDLAEATLLAKKVFREGSRFPSPRKIFELLPGRHDRTEVISPVTGKPVRYEIRPEPTSWQSIFP